MKTLAILFISIIFNTAVLSYEYNFIDSKRQKGLFKNDIPYSSIIENCINIASSNNNYILKDSKEFLYVERSRLILNNCDEKFSIIKDFNNVITNEIIFKNNIYLSVNNEIWSSDGTEDGTYLLKKGLDKFSFHMTKYNLYVILYPSMSGLKIYTIDQNNRTLKRVLKGISIGSSRFAYFAKPYLYITRYGSLFKMNEINYEIKVINDQPLVYYPSFLASIGEKLVHFVPEKGEIFITNGTKEGTHMIKSFRNTKKDIYFKIHTVFDNKILFVTQDVDNNIDLYETDGTEEGTVFVKKMDN